MNTFHTIEENDDMSTMIGDDKSIEMQSFIKG